MGWVKQGLIYKPEGNLEWSKTHAQVPVVYDNGEVLKVYFSTRDDQHRSLPGMVELDRENPTKILFISESPLLEIGELGTFDDCGVMPSWVIDKGKGEVWMYYIGWNVRNTIPYHNAIGLAISKDGGNTFTKFSRGPLWDRDFKEPHYSGSSCVINIEGVWFNYYLSCTEWREINGKSEPRYHIKIATSADGIHWKRKGKVAIDYKDNEEAGIVKASVVPSRDGFQMWYSYRNFNNYRTDKNNSYRIGYATSKNGFDWQRQDNDPKQCLDISSEEGWDSLMVAYPHVIDVDGKRLMFYNGNGFGESGFGYAIYKEDQ